MTIDKKNAIICLITSLGIASASVAFNLPLSFNLVAGFITGFCFPFLKVKQ